MDDLSHRRTKDLPFGRPEWLPGDPIFEPPRPFPRWARLAVAALCIAGLSLWLWG